MVVPPSQSQSQGTETSTSLMTARRRSLDVFDEGTYNPSANLLKTLEKSIDDLRGLITCRVCIRPMYEPYTIACGHTFCYSCLSQWFYNHNANKTCPDCRTRVLQQPAPAYVLREMIQLFVTRTELIPLGETTEDHKKSSEEEANLVERDRLNPDPRIGGLFRGCFKAGSLIVHPPIRDDEDGVTRCPNCAWELEDGFCNACQVGYDTDGVPYDADSLDWSEDDNDSDVSLGFYGHHHHAHSVSDDEDGHADLGDSEDDISLDEDGNSVHTVSEGHIGRGEFTFARNTAHELLHNRLSRRHFNPNRISRRRYASSLPPDDESSQAENGREREYEEGNDDDSNLSVPPGRSDEEAGSLDQLAIDDDIKYEDGTDDEPSTYNFSPILASDDEPQDTYGSELGHESGTSIPNSDDQEINDEYASDGHMHNSNSDYSESETDTTIGYGNRLYRQVSNRQQRLQPITTSESEAEGSPRQAPGKERVARHPFRPAPRVSSRVNDRIVTEQSDSDHPVRSRKRRIIVNESSSDDPVSDVEPNRRYKRNRNVNRQHVVDV